MPDPLVIAHRGSSAAVAEHTVGAYRQAIAEGVDALECDVRLSADGELVCLHDRTLERTGGSTGIVSTMTLAELRSVDWGAWKHGTDGDRDPDSGALVTLRELVELALGTGREIGLAVETKHPSRAGGRVEHEVAKLLEEYELDGPRRPGQVWARMMSFSAIAVRRMASLCPELPLVLLVSAQQLLPTRRLVTGAGTAGLDLALVRERPEIVQERHEAGNDVWAWTVDDEADIRLCKRLDVDAIISNRPAVVLDLLGRNR
ncbi:MAG: glycerophosphodiester phosphodiesterase family protein [Lapillicoccus sp.]